MLEFLDLVLELLDVLLFALTERTLPRLAKCGTSATANVLERRGSVPRACWSTVLAFPFALQRHRWGRLGSCSAASRRWLGRCAAEVRQCEAAVAGWG